MDGSRDVRVSAANWWRLYMRFGQVVSVGGGSVTLLVAFLGHDKASIALLVIGAAWLVMGLFGTRAMARTAMEIVLERGQVSFTGQRIRRTMPATDLASYRGPAFRRGAPPGSAYFTTVQGEKVLVAPNMKGMLDLLLALKQTNEPFRVV